MKTNLNKLMNTLEAMGVDTTKFVVSLNNITINIDSVELNSLVENKYVQNEKIDRRWITAQTFRMLNHPSGWDACLRLNYHYIYQFKMLVEELKTQSKLEIQKKFDALKERQKFFNRDVVVATCQYHINVVRNEELQMIVDQMYHATTVTELYGLLKAFYKRMDKHAIRREGKKCPVWKDAFKGAGAYESLKNMVKYHGVHINHLYDKDALAYLSVCADEYSGEGWRMHALLKKVIADNNFDLARSIEAHK